MDFSWLKNKYYLWLIFYGLLIMMVFGFIPEYNLWFGKNDNGLLFKSLYKLLNGKWLINIPIMITIITLFVCRLIKIWKEKDYRIHRLPILISVIIILCCDKHFIYANIIYNFDYKTLIIILLIINIILQIIKGLLYLNINTTTNNKKAIGFTTDSVEFECIPRNLNQYAKIIVDRLMSTMIDNKSYAMGIIGEWGVGKTSFLEIIKQQIGDNAEIVVFNPWMCRTPEQVTHDFFASLSHQLSSKYSTLSKSIKDYARHINDIKLTPYKLFDFTIQIKEESLYQKKCKLSKKLSKLPIPIVVFIDDIDRLEKNEVFEVLRLIRNTADLNKIIYIAAYDKRYVVKTLEERNINNASLYLEKIFPIEIYIPKVSDFLILDVLKNEIKSQNDIVDNFENILFSHLTSDDINLILKVLNNYRKVKRFARLYMLNVKYINTQIKGEIKLIDFFWLVLLQIYDREIYTELENNPYSILYIDHDRFKILQAKKSTINESYKILEKIFGDNINTKKESICYIENYDKYFILNVSPYKLSINDISKIFIPKSNIEVIIQQWIEEKKSFQSILTRMKGIDINQLSHDDLIRYFNSLLYLGLKIISYQNNYKYYISFIKDMLITNKIKNITKQNEVHDIILSWFEDRINKINELVLLGILLNNIYMTKDIVNTNYTLIISNTEIENLLIKIMRKYLLNHPEHTALDIIKDSNNLALLFKNCCLKTNIIVESVDNFNHKQVAFDVVIEYFSKLKNKPNINEFEDIYNNLIKYKIPENLNAEDYYDYIDDQEEYITNKIINIFGNSYEDNIKKFKELCFIETNNMIS